MNDSVDAWRWWLAREVVWEGHFDSAHLYQRMFGQSVARVNRTPLINPVFSVRTADSEWERIEFVDGVGTTADGTVTFTLNYGTHQISVSYDTSYADGEALPFYVDFESDISMPLVMPYIESLFDTPEPFVSPEEIPDLTDKQRARWRREAMREQLEPSYEPTGALTIDELLGRIDEVLADAGD